MKLSKSITEFLQKSAELRKDAPKPIGLDSHHSHQTEVQMRGDTLVYSKKPMAPKNGPMPGAAAPGATGGSMADLQTKPQGTAGAPKAGAKALPQLHVGNRPHQGAYSKPHPQPAGPPKMAWYGRDANKKEVQLSEPVSLEHWHNTTPVKKSDDDIKPPSNVVQFKPKAAAPAPIAAPGGSHGDKIEAALAAQRVRQGNEAPKDSWGSMMDAARGAIARQKAGRPAPGDPASNEHPDPSHVGPKDVHPSFRPGYEHPSDEKVAQIRQDMDEDHARRKGLQQQIQAEEDAISPEDRKAAEAKDQATQQSARAKMLADLDARLKAKKEQPVEKSVIQFKPKAPAAPAAPAGGSRDDKINAALSAQRTKLGQPEPTGGMTDSWKKMLGNAKATIDKQKAGSLQKSPGLKQGSKLGHDIYDETANIGRKMTRTGQEATGAGIRAEQTYGGKAGHMTAKDTARHQEKIDAKKNKKQPVKVASPEEVAAMNEKIKALHSTIKKN